MLMYQPAGLPEREKPNRGKHIKPLGSNDTSDIVRPPCKLGLVKDIWGHHELSILKPMPKQGTDFTDIIKLNTVSKLTLSPTSTPDPLQSNSIRALQFFVRAMFYLKIQL
jgi:hypothetical protein